MRFDFLPLIFQANATTLVGQCAISHPTPPPTPVPSTPTTPAVTPIPSRQGAWQGVTKAKSNHIPPYRRDSRTFDTDDLTHALDDVADTPEEEWSGGNLGYRKGAGEVPLEARIERIFYINLYGQVSSQSCHDRAVS